MRIIFASFPRSGHHIITSIIQDYAKECQLEFSYCEFYNHSNTTTPPHQCTIFPNCKDALLLKTHDFALNSNCNVQEWKKKIEITPDNRYIVLYRRECARQLEAWYRHSKQNSNKDWQSYSDFDEFVKTNIEYYKAFKEKWIVKTYNNVTALTYEDFIKEPLKVMKEIIQIIYPDSDIQIPKLRKIILSHNVGWKNTLTSEVYTKLKDVVNSYMNTNQ
jgi:hypothetical protein